MLPSDGFRPPTAIVLVFKKDMKGVAFTSGHQITIAADWVRRHPEDKGMVVHELVHIIQSYPPTRSGWLVEGIADWVRFFKFEPETKLAPPDPKVPPVIATATARRPSFSNGWRHVRSRPDREAQRRAPPS